MKITGNTSIPAFPKIRGSLANIRYPCYAEVKIDGEANVYYNGTLTSKASGKVRRDFPVTEILSNTPKDTMLFGELYWGEGKAGALYDFLSHSKDDALKFCIFDAFHPTLIMADYETRREWLIDNVYPALGDKTVITTTRPIYVEDKTTLDALVEVNKQDGWEGVVVKNRDSVLFAKTGMIGTQLGWVKLKHTFTMDCVIKAISNVQERMDVDANGRLVGVKLVNKYKPFVKPGDTIEVEHMGVLAQGGLRHPVYRGKVVKSV